MALNLSILYRGPLTSCNYDCGYCPFAKRAESAAELAVDREALERFAGWVAFRPAEDRIGILFTPWGEALIRRWYREALIRLSHVPAVVRVAIQTNLATAVDWVDDCDKSRLALWTTYHPTQVKQSVFLGRCAELRRRGVRFSVGVVGLREHFGAIGALRQALPADVYLWVNAFKDRPDYYGVDEVEWLTRIDGLFPNNNRRHPSEGRPCRTGHSVIAVAGDGTIRRCHFIKTVLGNLYETGWEDALRQRCCTNATCGCHIGYVHMPELGLYDVFGDGVLERVPRALRVLG
jgi:hypothetical protein